MPDHSQFNIDRTYPGLWTITFSNPPINMFVPTTIVELGALMTDLEACRWRPESASIRRGMPAGSVLPALAPGGSTKLAMLS